MRAVARRFAADTRGLALIEFALVLPFMLLLYLGGVQLSEAMACNRKVAVATRALVDLAAQSVSGVTSAKEVDGDLKAALIVLQPYQSSNAQAKITEVYTNSSAQTSVVWSRAVNTTAYVKGATVTIPSNLKVAGTYLLLSEISYAYTPPVTYDLVKPLTFGSNIFMLPRNTSSVSCSDC